MLPVESQDCANPLDQTPMLKARRVAVFDVVTWIVLAALSLIGVAIVLLCTSSYGVGTTPDSANYLSAARSLLAGKGYLHSDGTAYTQWTPLFPTLLAALGLLRIEPLLGGRILNALAFGCIILISGRLFARCTTRVLALMGTLSVLISVPLLYVSVMLWSEPVFVVLTLLFVWTIADFLRSGRRSPLILASLFTALACLERYAGVAVILAGSILILAGMSGSSAWRRLKCLVGFGFVSGAPLAVWVIRNRLLAGRTAGGHHLHLADIAVIGQAFLTGTDVIATWLFPPSFSLSGRLIGVGILVALLAVVAGLSHYRLRGRESMRTAVIRCAAVLVLAYLGFLAFCAAGMSWPLDGRLMSPLYCICILLVLAGLDDACKLLGGSGRRAWIGAAVSAFLCFLWLWGRFPLMCDRVAEYLKVGPIGYTAAVWRDSALMAWLRDRPLQGKIFSNVADAVYILSGEQAEITPLYNWDVSRFADRLAASDQAYIVWCDNRSNAWLFDERELRSRYKMEEIAALPDGRVYRASGEILPEPWLWAVYRFASLKTDVRFYTIDKQLRDKMLEESSDTWLYEKTCFHAFTEQRAGTRPVHHLWSERLGAHFYTIDEAEKDRFANDPSGDWTYKDIAFYAFPQELAEDLVPVYRVRPPDAGWYLYTASPHEREKLIHNNSHPWIDEGIAWYAYEP
jgi:hypothetical protein